MMDKRRYIGNLFHEVPGVDALYLYEEDSRTYVYVVAREHSSVSIATLLLLEETLTKLFGRTEVMVRAHQGRDPDTVISPEFRVALNPLKERSS